jgi:hypothetical protein
MSDSINTSAVSADLIAQYMQQLQMQQGQSSDDDMTLQAKEKQIEEELTQAITQNMQQAQLASQGTQNQTSNDPNLFMQYSMPQESVHLK